MIFPFTTNAPDGSPPRLFISLDVTLAGAPHRTVLADWRSVLFLVDLCQMHVRDGSGSGGIVSQMKASIESKAKAAATSPSRPGAPNSTKQKINVGRTNDASSCITLNSEG